MIWLVLPLLPWLPPMQEETPLERDDTVIARSARVKPGTYRIEDAREDGVVRIQGDDLVVDFQGAFLIGAPDDRKPDQFRGVGVIAEGCKNLTIRNLRVKGFKVGIKLERCDGLKLEGCDVSQNYRQHLKSTPRAEDLADWLYGHENDKDEWLRYGAGIWVGRSKNVTLARNRARNGQNGILLVRVDDSKVVDNDVAFMSGWGLGMWRSSRNDVSNNRFDWCMRGFSHKVYHRGQDSAGILVYEQCHDNVFAYNSATHGGDGFFLYAGNETLERTGEGGCNGNVLYRNDFSHAAANGIEATFSRGNKFIENVLDECDHGIWGGYSYDTVILGNKIRNCNNGISIEHGHGNHIEGNTFEKTGTGVNLWWNPNDAFLAKPYGRKQDTKSHGYAIARNTFRETKVAIRLVRTSDVAIAENAIDGGVALRTEECQRIRASIEGRIEGPEPERGKVEVARRDFEVPKTAGTLNAFLPEGGPRGYRYIFVDDWGPYDFASLRAFPAEIVAWGWAEVFVSGPNPDGFQVARIEGDVEVTPPSGKFPATLKVATRGGCRTFRFQVLSGAARAEVSGVILDARWNVAFYRWPAAGAQKPPADWKAVIDGVPVERRTVDRLDFAWGGGAPSDKVPGDHFATVATTEIELPAGKWRVRTVSDDGVRVFVGERKVIDNWTWHGPTEDRASVDLEAGKHRIRVEHFEIDGVAQLQLWLEPETLRAGPAPTKKKVWR